MKIWAWLVAIGVLVLVIFGITFMSNYDPDQGKQALPTMPGPSILTGATSPEPEFATKVFPLEEADSMLQEFHKPGYHDYWLTNPHDQVIRFGLEGKKCTCTSVFYFPVPQGHPYWSGTGKAFLKEGKPDLARLQVAQGGPGFLETEKTLSPTELTNRNEAVELQPGEVGLVRMTWKNEKQQKDVMTATFWLGTQEQKQFVRLEARINTQAVLLVPEAVADLGNLSANGKPSVERQVAIHCPTRANLTEKDLRVALTSSRPGKECVVIKEVRKATQAQLQLKRKETENPLESVFFVTLLATWKPVEGGLPEIGPLVRRLEVSTIAPDVAELARYASPVRVTCRIEGDVEVVGTDDRGYVLLNRFERQDGTRTAVILETRDPGLTLEVDKERSPTFVQVEIDKRPKVSGERLRWEMRLVVPPGKVSGDFPRAEGVYRDCAVFLKIGGEKPRSLRIPISGRADN